MDVNFNFELGAFIILLLLICLWLLSSKEDENKVARAVLSKALMYLDGICFMFCFSENKGMGSKKNPDPDRIKEEVAKGETIKKRIIFIRHGESDWNNVFNKGFGPSFPIRLFKAWLRELWLYPTTDSGNKKYFFD